MRNRLVLALVALVVSLATMTAPVQAQSSVPPAQELTHIVQPGETMFSIARRYGLSVNAIAHANGIADPWQIFAGQQLLIPGFGHAMGADTTIPYVVNAGDSLLSVATLYGTTWQELARMNHLISPGVVHVGQVILVPTVTAHLLDGSVVDSTLRLGTRNVIRDNDTLFRIALRYGVSTWTLAAISNVPNPVLLHPGQEVIVPGDGTGMLPQPFSAVRITPLPVHQGQTMMIAVDTAAPVYVEGAVFEQALEFVEEEGIHYAFVGVHVFADPGLYDLDITAVDSDGRRTSLTTRVVVTEGQFAYERIDLPASREGLLDPYVVADERDRLDLVLYLVTPARQWAGVFQKPAAGAVSSYFGSHRSVNGGPYTTFHSGIDFRSPTGTPVYAAGAGTVVLVEPLAICGNTIILDHGLGVMTGYCHLSAMDVQVGQQVAAGQLIGKVGNTGRSTGAHLHWEVWVRGTSVDGFQWLDGFGVIPDVVPE
ncbi:MAG: LysM peptidoglycan-binding domain-containing protein [Chloroflexi bacterium]|nr:LysM peptidoglycan-binding domain-containing protein [Chloroflexota bacterium]